MAWLPPPCPLPTKRVRKQVISSWKRGYNREYLENRDLRLKLNPICTQCGLAWSIETHHRIPLAQGGDNGLENLQAICRNCHQQITNEQNRSG